ncbi:MAG: hypothetical protein WDW36_006352 [Sanguina aurantia]
MPDVAMGSNPPPTMLEDLCVQFILTAPDELLKNFLVLFLAEQAWWFYEDVIRKDAPGLRTYTNKTSWVPFLQLLFGSCAELRHLVANVEGMVAEFGEYKAAIPVRGGIILDAALEQVLCKINAGEADMDCAAREVEEETGFDMRPLLKEENVLERFVKGKNNKMFIVSGVDLQTTEFKPKHNYEIGGYSWFRIDDLPATYDEANLRQTSLSDGKSYKFFAVQPFITPPPPVGQAAAPGPQSGGQEGGGCGTVRAQADWTQPTPLRVASPAPAVVVAAQHVRFPLRARLARPPLDGSDLPAWHTPARAEAAIDDQPS